MAKLFGFTIAVILLSPLIYLGGVIIYAALAAFLPVTVALLGAISLLFFSMFWAWTMTF